jgi:hypothetical protein
MGVLREKLYQRANVGSFPRFHEELDELAAPRCAEALQFRLLRPRRHSTGQRLTGALGRTVDRNRGARGTGLGRDVHGGYHKR